MPKDQILTLGSPFKFGFFAGLGFFFASALLSAATFLLVAIIGLGSLGALLVHAQPAQTNPDQQPKPAMAVTELRVPQNQ